MLGVILWSDTNDNKAVIWCEDHGDLAFFNGGSERPDALLDFDAGDLVQFDLREDRHQRLARNPRRVGQGAFAGLPDTLSATRPAAKSDNTIVEKTDPEEAMVSAKIIPFAPAQPRQQERSLELA
ncbi:hypothetical protein [Shimia sp.]|uniref:hypothetical protein n=1 Tax=Shimia sp. TaxID=1954381 RepID=UPI0032978530